MRSQLRITFFFTLISLFPLIGEAQVRLKAVGDIMIGDTSKNYAVPNHNYLQNVLVELADADLTFGNHEGTICDTEKVSWKCEGKKSCFAFKTPSSFVNYFLDAGIDVMSVANNHIYDYFDLCADKTVEHLEASEILAIGLLNSSDSADSTLIKSVEVNGLQVAFLAFHYSNGWGRLISIHEIERAAKLVEEASSKNDLVVVSMHVGAEGTDKTYVPKGEERHRGENRGDSQQFSYAMIDAGADLIIGHGPHVLRPLELYKDRLIAYSLGNFATFGRFLHSFPMNLGAILEVQMNNDGSFESGKIISTIQTPSSLTLDPQERAFELMEELTAQHSPSPFIFESDGNFRLEEGRAKQ